MISLASTDLQKYLESRHGHKIIGMIDLDDLINRPRKTLYQYFDIWRKPAFDVDERIVLFTRTTPDHGTLVHIQRCASLIDISNFFILLCGSQIDRDQLESVRRCYSSDDCVFSSLEINITDPMPVGIKNPLITLPETFCFSPWAHMEISSQGEFKPCCVYKESIKDVDGRAFNINEDSVEEVYNSDYLSDLRQQFLAGEKPSGCSNCWLKEQYNGISNRHWLSTHLGLAAQTLEIEQESIDNLISLDIKLGNLCNFKCRICNPKSSSKIAEEYSKHFNVSLDLKGINQKGLWTKNPDIWKMLNSLGKQLVNIDFYGGEPFLIKQHEVFLDYLIDNNYSNKIRLHYNSNGSIFPGHLFEKWKSFRQIDIAFSIDDIGQRFEIERSGDWQNVSHNLDQFLISKLPNMVLSVFTTVSVQNIYYLDRLIDWFETKNFNDLVFNLLEFPEIFSITAMGKELSALVINRLNQINKEKISRYNLGTFIKLIEQHKDSPDQIDQLRDHMLKLDKIRNQNFSQSHPEIANIIYKGN